MPKFFCVLARALAFAPSHSLACTYSKARLPSRLIAGIALCMLIAGDLRPADAAFHFYYIQEIYSNQSGSVQFIELFTNSGSQEFYGGQTLTSTTNQHSFEFIGNGPAPTAGKHVLLATAGFGSIPGGATPNFTLPSNFFDPAGDTISLFDGVDDKSFVSAPTNGVNSLNYTGQFTGGVIDANSPRNYAGAGTSVNLPPPTGDYNGNHVVDAADYVFWRNTLGSEVSPFGSGADGYENGTIDDGDFTYWRSKFGNPAGSGSGHGQGSTVPEPAAGALLLMAFLGARSWRRRR